MNLFTWTPGRQGSGYEKLCLIYSKLLRLDCYLLHYPTGVWIGWHTDPVPGARHYRLNFELWRAQAGGVYRYADSDWGREAPKPWQWWRFTFMRPDLTPHSVTPITAGTRWVLSVGWLR